jgi:integrase/recombinase XerD
MDEKSQTELILNSSPNSKVFDNRKVTALARSSSTRPVSFLAESEVYRISDVAMSMRDGPRNELLILILFQCALRISEAVNLTVGDKTRVEEKHLIHVIGKGHKPRLVAVPEKLFYQLGNYASEHNLGRGDRFFPITRIRAWQIVKYCADQAGIERRVYCHLFRHSGAIARLKRTGNPKSLQMFLGHSDMKMKMRYLSTTQLIDSLDTESKVEFDR